MPKSMIILDKTYYAETLPDLEEDISHTINLAELPVDEHGFDRGEFRVTITWTDADPST